MIVGSGKFQYRVNADWARLPEGWSFKEVGGVGVDSQDNVYVFNRGEHPMMVFDREGNFLRSWGEGQYPREGKLIGRFGDTPAGTELGKFLAPHGLAVDSHGDVYVGEVSWTGWPQIFPDTPRPTHIRCLQKFEKVQ